MKGPTESPIFQKRQSDGSMQKPIDSLVNRLINA